MQNEKSEKWKECTMKLVEYEKSATWKECNKKRVQHGKKYNMEIVQHEQSIDWNITSRNGNKFKKSSNSKCSDQMFL